MTWIRLRARLGPIFTKFGTASLNTPKNRFWAVPKSAWSGPRDQIKVTIHADLPGQSRILTACLGIITMQVFRDAELSRIPNPVPILSRYECDVTSCVDKVCRPTLVFSIRSLIAFPLIPKHVILNDLEWLFCVKFCFAPMAFEAWLLLNL